MSGSPQRNWWRALLLAAVVFFADGLFFNKRSILWDTWTEFYPTMRYTAALWRHGIMPLWNPYLFNGYPCYADPQNQTFYPLNMLLGLVVNLTPRFVYLQEFLHFVLAGLGMYLYAGLYARNGAARLLAAMVYMFNGYMIGHFEHLTAIDCIPWLPLTAWCFEMTLRTDEWRFCGLAALGFGCLILCGHPQSAFYEALILVSLVAVRAALFRSAKGLPKVVLALMLAGAMGGIQLVPTLQFSHQTNRTGRLPYEVAAGYAVPAQHAATLLLPNFYGSIHGKYVGLADESMASYYCGVAFLLLLPYALAEGGGMAVFFGLVFVGTIWLCMGDQGKFFKLCYHAVPGFSLFRQTGMYMFGAPFGAAMLTALGAERVMRGGARLRPMLWALFACAVFSAALLSLAPLETYSSCLANLWLLLALGAVLVVVVSRLEPEGRRYGLLLGLVCLLSFVDFYVHGAHASTFGAKEKHRDVEQASQSIRDIQAAVLGLPGTAGIESPQRPLTAQRLYQLDGLPTHTKFLPMFAFVPWKSMPVRCNAVMVFGLPAVDGYDPMMTKRYLQFCTSFRDEHFERFLDLCAVQFVVTAEGQVQQRPAPPPAYMVHGVEPVDEASGLARLGEAAFDPFKTALIEGGRAQSLQAADHDHVAMLHFNTQECHVETESTGDGLLVWSTAYYPGWCYSVDNTGWKPVVRANYLFMGGYVPAGHHVVRFKFRPIVGPPLLLSCAAALLALVMGARGLSRPESDKA
jgi:hypothetical protein